MRSRNAKQAIDIGEVRHERAEKIGERKILLGCNQEVRNASRGKSVQSGRLPKFEALVRHTLPQTQSWRVRTLTVKMDKRSIFVVYVLTGGSVTKTTLRSIRSIRNEGLMGISAN